MTPTPGGSPQDSLEGDADRPSSARVEQFLEVIEQDRTTARRNRWVGLGVGVVIGGVAFLTAIGVVPVAAENLVLSASAVVAGFALSKG